MWVGFLGYAGGLEARAVSEDSDLASIAGTDIWTAAEMQMQRANAEEMDCELWMSVSEDQMLWLQDELAPALREATSWGCACVSVAVRTS